MVTTLTDFVGGLVISIFTAWPDFLPLYPYLRRNRAPLRGTAHFGLLEEAVTGLDPFKPSNSFWWDFPD